MLIFIYMVKRKITYASARNKGKTLERQVAKDLKNIGVEAQRVPMSGALSWLKGDVVEMSSIKPHLHECKNHEQLSLGSWWEQTTSQCLNQEVPVLHFTSNYKPIYTMLSSEHFDDLLFAYEQYHRELNVKVIDTPPRKNFWKVSASQLSPYTAYILEDNVVILFTMYLMLRRSDIKYQTDCLIK